MEMSDPFDILITGGTALTLSAEMEVIENPVIGIRDDRIALVEKGSPAADGYVARERLDASGCVILPGLVNTHTHLPMVSFRGYADDLPLLEWLHGRIFPAEAKHVNRGMVYDASRLAMAEMILTGTTTFCDAYFYESAIAQASLDMGMRGVVAQGFIDFPTPDQPDPTRNLQIAEAFIDKWKDRSPLISPALFCHTPFTCLPQTLTDLKRTAREREVLYLSHVAETREEIKIIQERYGTTPVRHLRNLGVLDERTVAVHAVWLDEEELDMLRDSGAKVSHNPESNMKLASGVAPVPAMLRRGITVGLGTDGCASNNDLDLFREMGTAAKLHKVTSMDPTVLDARTALKMATIDGARVLGMEDRIGSIETGKCADLICVRMDMPHLTPVYHLYSHLVYAASGADVTAGIIGGRLVMKDRRLLHADLEEIMERVRKIAAAVAKG
ncbi:MAG: 5-methylthioadenosine/S-adenosylhomocysteine deaminase [Syntrophaceae bacterium PtaB.Bin095]|jgi:5-methylthioadenosine/S-adenosylhomocysteine deaminase|nr:MAG: 5-methylthioadenosine/S-adenosylhomocysteine deaminase [Syntrophaceae bacterium PtaB.Bin095]